MQGPIRGRGTHLAPPSRFERLALEPDPGAADERTRHPSTRYLRDAARSALATNRSPDVGFDTSLNPYRGCEHGCVYCYARPGHEYLGLSAGLDFETTILVKEDAPRLLREALAAPGWRPRAIALSGVTDPYQPVERRTGLTRRCLEVLAEFRNPVQLITKSAAVARDADVLAELAAHGAVSVSLSLTCLDRGLARVLEPRAAQPAARLAAIEALAGAGIPVGVMVAPVIPGLTDHEIPGVLRAAADAGAGWAGHILLRLPHGVVELFTRWLDDHFPERRDRVLQRIRDVRGGGLNDPRFGTRMRGTGRYAEQVHALFRLARERAGLRAQAPELSTAAFRRPAPSQLELLP